MRVYTAQISYRGADGLDITVKSSRGLARAFAPTWEIVLGHKAGTISDEEYVQRYKAMLRRSYVRNRKAWEWLLAQEEVTLLCYCRRGKFCHRLILADILSQAFGAEYRGERD